jgi:hypothetical protein
MFCCSAWRKSCPCFVALVMPLLLASCASLLPSGRSDVRTPWSSYQDAEAMFTKITPNVTRRADLTALGIDPVTTPNVALLNHADLLRRFASAPSIGPEAIDDDLRKCFAARVRCTAYEIEQTHLDRKRVGNFWLDFMNFRRSVDATGWRFNALIVLNDGLVVYKLWSGKPNIQEHEDQRNPLGPLQGIGDSLIRGRM